MASQVSNFNIFNVQTLKDSLSCPVSSTFSVPKTLSCQWCAGEVVGSQTPAFWYNPHKNGSSFINEDNFEERDVFWFLSHPDLLEFATCSIKCAKKFLLQKSRKQSKSKILSNNQSKNSFVGFQKKEDCFINKENLSTFSSSSSSSPHLFLCLPPNNFNSTSYTETNNSYSSISPQTQLFFRSIVALRSIYHQYQNKEGKEKAHTSEEEEEKEKDNDDDQDQDQVKDLLVSSNFANSIDVFKKEQQKPIHCDDDDDEYISGKSKNDKKRRRFCDNEEGDSDFMRPRKKQILTNSFMSLNTQHDIRSDDEI